MSWRMGPGITRVADALYIEQLHDECEGEGGSGTEGGRGREGVGRREWDGEGGSGTEGDAPTGI
eukprot:759461-Hanusia_phi.AAC.1